MPGPVSYTVTAQAKQVWSGRNITQSGISTVLLMNTDLLNTVKVGTDLTSVIVPIAPNGSLSVDPSSNWYVQGSAAGTAPLVVVPNGQSNFLGLTQGLGSLAIPAIFSPNFIHNVSGWSIDQNGNAEFNNLQIRGTFLGVDFIINSLGIFIYSGTPATGNLIGSWAPAAGANDGLGNAFLKDVAVYAAVNTGYANLSSTGGLGGNTALLLHPGGTAYVTTQPQLLGGSFNGGAVNEIENIHLSSGQAGNDNADLLMQSSSADNTIAALANFQFNGTIVFLLTKILLTISVPITATSGTASNPTVITTDPWKHATLLNGWTAAGNANGVLYRMTTDQELEILIDVLNAGAVVNSVVATFSAPYIPTRNLTHEVGGSLAGIIWCELDTSGNLTMVGTNVANKEVGGRLKYPLGTLPAP